MPEWRITQVDDDDSVIGWIALVFAGIGALVGGAIGAFGDLGLSGLGERALGFLFGMIVGGILGGILGIILIYAIMVMVIGGIIVGIIWLIIWGIEKFG